MINPGALLYDVPLLHRPVPIGAELRGIVIKINFTGLYYCII